MKIRVLGCHGAQLPGYNTTSFLLNENVLIDAGAATTVLSLRQQLKIEYVIITHAHLDHIRDIPFLVDNIFYAKRKKPLVLVSTRGILEVIHRHLFNNAIWPDFSMLPSEKNPLLKFKEIMPGKRQTIGDWSVRAVWLDHTVESVGYIIENKEKAVMFFGDTGPTQKAWHMANMNKKLQAVFIETSLPDSMKDIADATGHLTPSSLHAQLKELKSSSPKIFLYHVKPYYRQVIHKEIKEIRERRIRIIEDGQVIRI